MFCKNCGTKNEATDNFCKNCGTPLENTQKKEESQFEKVAKKKSNPIFIIIGIIIVVAILYIGRQVPQQLIIPETEKYGNEEYVIAEYDTGDYKGALALKKAEDENVLWIQTVSSSTTRGRKILTEFIPIITTAKKIGMTTSDTDKEISMSVMNTLTGLLDK